VIIVVSAIIALTLWVILWSLNVKGFDGFMLVLLILLIGVLIKTVLPYLPGNRSDPPARPGA
jgi:hypothetical protein